jgi:hypothetical protein
LLESLPFPCGYRGEFGGLVDIYRAYGREVLAQVDHHRPQHRNQDQHKLGRMANDILQVADAPLGRALEPPVELTPFSRSGDGYRIVDTDMTELERRPLADLRRQGRV